LADLLEVDFGKKKLTWFAKEKKTTDPNERKPEEIDFFLFVVPCVF
jgi:hypothetical protein